MSWWVDFVLHQEIHLIGQKFQTRVFGMIIVVFVGCHYLHGATMIRTNILIVYCLPVYVIILITVTMILLLTFFVGLDIMTEMIPVQ